MSHLAQVAATLGAGKFGLVNNPGQANDGGYGPAIFGPDNNDAREFATKCCYDADRSRIHFKGGPDPMFKLPPVSPHDGRRHGVYDIQTNQWTLAGWDQKDADTLGLGNVHSYQLQTIIQPLRKFIYVYAGSSDLRQCDIDVDDPATIDKASWTDYPNPPTGASYGAIEYFPDRHSLCWIDSQGGEFYEKHLNDDAWGSPITQKNNWATLGMGMIYNPKKKCLLMGGSTQNHKEVWIYKEDGTLVRATDCPVDLYFHGQSIGWADSVSGDYCFLAGTPLSANTELRFYTYNVTADTWARRTDIEANIPPDLGYYTTTTPGLKVFSCVVVGAHDLGVAVILSHKVWIYKHSENNWANEMSEEDRDTLPGFVKRWPFDSVVDANPSGWDRSDPALNTVMSGYTYAGLSDSRLPGQAVSLARHWHTATPQAPYIETDGLAFYTPGRTPTSGLEFQHNANGILTAGQSWYVSPISPHGRSIWMAARVKMNAAQVQTCFRGVAGTLSQGGGYTVTTPGAGSDRILLSPGWFTPELVGREVYIPAGTGTNFKGDTFHQILEVVSPTEIRVSNSANLTPGGAGSRGWVNVGGDPDTSMWTGTLSSTASAPDIIVATPGPRVYSFTPTMVGKSFRVWPGVPNGGGGGYTEVKITQFIDSTHVRVNVNLGPFTGGYGKIGDVGGGMKLGILTGNPPSGHLNNEVVINHGGQFGFFQLYFAFGNEGAALQFAKPILVNQEMEIAMHVEYLGPQGRAGTQRTRIFQDGVKIIDNINATPSGAQPWGGLGGVYTFTSNGTAAGTGNVTAVKASSSSGTGTGAKFDISWSGGGYTVTRYCGGRGYKAGDILTFNGTLFGGTAANNLTVTVSTIDNGNNDGLGEVYWLTYQTNKDATQHHDLAITWVKDLRISTEPIPLGRPTTAGVTPTRRRMRLRK